MEVSGFVFRIVQVCIGIGRVLGLFRVSKDVVGFDNVLGLFMAVIGFAGCSDGFWVVQRLIQGCPRFFCGHSGL